MQRLGIVRDEKGFALSDKNGTVRQEFADLHPFSMQKKLHVCPIHGEVPCDVAVLNGSPTSTYCPICGREEEKRQKEEEERRREEKQREALLESYKEMNVEREYWDKTIDDYKPMVPEQEKAKAAVKRLIERRRGKVILLGSNGSGKTLLGSCAVKALGGKIYTMYEISTMIRQAYSPLAKRSELEIVSELAEVPMLFIDELGRTKGSAAELNWLSFILDKRHQRDLPFGLGTNSHLMRDCPRGKEHCEQCFENFLGNDILSRLGQDSEIVTMYNAPDYRRLKIKP